MIPEKFLNPWFTNNPRMIGRAIRYDLGLVKRGECWVKTCFGSKVYCDTGKAIGRSIYRNGVYELPISELIWRSICRTEENVFVDVGANVGYFSALARKRMANEGQVIAFEPEPKLYKILTRNLSFESDLLFDYAMTSSSGKAILNIPVGSEVNDGIATLEDCEEKIDSITVTAKTLDSLIKNRISLLKVDVEGHELNVLRGAKNLLENKLIKTIIFEDHHIDSSGIAGFLKSFNYDVFKIDWSHEGLKLKSIGERTIRSVQEAQNYVATIDSKELFSSMEKPGWSVLSSEHGLSNPPEN